MNFTLNFKVSTQTNSNNFKLKVKSILDNTKGVKRWISPWDYMFIINIDSETVQFSLYEKLTLLRLQDNNINFSFLLSPPSAGTFAGTMSSSENIERVNNVAKFAGSY